MVTFKDLDADVPFFAQLEKETGPIILVNTFIVPDGGYEAVLSAWEKDSAVLKAKPGFISTQLHRGIGGSHVLINVATWESTKTLRDALASAEFQELLDCYPDDTVVCPTIVQKLAVNNVCVS